MPHTWASWSMSAAGSPVAESQHIKIYPRHTVPEVRRLRAESHQTNASEKVRAQVDAEEILGLTLPRPGRDRKGLEHSALRAVELATIARACSMEALQLGRSPQYLSMEVGVGPT